MSGWIGVDLDGTLAEYDGWRGATHIGNPIKPMVDRVKGWLAEGREVRIFTARVYHDTSADRAREAACAYFAIQRWCEEYIGRVLPITCMKDYGMVELWDDRVVQVRANTGEPVGFSTRGLEK